MVGHACVGPERVVEGGWQSTLIRCRWCGGVGLQICLRWARWADLGIILRRGLSSRCTSAYDSYL